MTTSSAALGDAARSGARVTVLAQAARVGLQLLAIVTLARILSPDDYGLVAMVVVIVGVAEVFRDFGLSMAAVQAKEVSRAQRDNLFWLNTAVGSALATVLFLGAPAVAAFYGRPELEDLSRVLALAFLLTSVSTQYRASLNRDLAFGKLNGSEIAGQAAGLIAGVWAAWAGWGYWALAAQQVVQALAALVMLVAVARWLPRWYRRDAPIRGFLGYGVNLLGVNLLTYGSKNLITVIIGASLGAGQLGVYNRAYQLLTLPLNQINAPSTRVALPVLARLQDDEPAFRRFLVKGQSMLLHLVIATFAIAAALAEPLIAVVLGPQWGAVVPVFQLLAIAGVFQSAGYVTYWVFLARGLTGSNLRFSLLTRSIQVAMLLAASPFGLFWLVAAYVAGVVVAWPISLLWLHRLGAIPVAALVGNVARTVVGYGMAGAAAWMASTAVAELGDLLQILLGCLAAAAALGLVLLCWPAFRRDLTGLLQLIRSRRRR